MAAGFVLKPLDRWAEPVVAVSNIGRAGGQHTIEFDLVLTANDVTRNISFCVEGPWYVLQLSGAQPSNSAAELYAMGATSKRLSPNSECWTLAKMRSGQMFTVHYTGTWSVPLPITPRLKFINSGEGYQIRNLGGDGKNSNKKSSLLLRLLGPSADPAVSIQSREVPGIDLATQRLAQRACSAAVGGRVWESTRSRLLTTKYFRLPPSVISTSERSNGDFQTLYALADVTTRRVMLFPAFLRPQQVLAHLAAEDLGADSISPFERAHGFREGSISPDILQALMLLHEQSHLNGTDVPDEMCVKLSMLNTRRIAESCFPEILDSWTTPSEMLQLK